MYLRGKIASFLKNWKADKACKPLILRGSRQVGETDSINHFARQNYESIIEINFTRDEKYKGKRVYTFPYSCAFLLKRFLTSFRPEKQL